MSDKMTTYTGKHFNPLEIKEENICIEDIAHALSLLCRGGGHLQYFYSVGQHSVNCAIEAQARRLSDKTILGCLLHDASEAYISDIIRPVKHHLVNYLEIESMIMEVIFQKFGLSNLSEQEAKQIKQIDDEMLENELPVLLRTECPESCAKLLSNPDFALLSARETEESFLALFHQLTK